MVLLYDFSLNQSICFQFSNNDLINETLQTHVSRYPPAKHSHSFLKYYLQTGFLSHGSHGRYNRFDRFLHTSPPQFCCFSSSSSSSSSSILLFPPPSPPPPQFCCFLLLLLLNSVVFPPPPPPPPHFYCENPPHFIYKIKTMTYDVIGVNLFPAN